MAAVHDMSAVRAKEARAKAAWYLGDTDTHPHGLSGHRHILPKELTSNCWDTAPGQHRFSEYGHHAGFPDADVHSQI